MSQNLQTTGGPVSLFSGIRNTGNDHLEHLHEDEKMKFSSVLGKYVVERPGQKQD